MTMAMSRLNQFVAVFYSSWLGYPISNLFKPMLVHTRSPVSSVALGFWVPWSGDWFWKAPRAEQRWDGCQSSPAFSETAPNMGFFSILGKWHWVWMVLWMSAWVSGTALEPVGVCRAAGEISISLGWCWCHPTQLWDAGGLGGMWCHGCRQKLSWACRGTELQASQELWSQTAGRVHGESGHPSV